VNWFYRPADLKLSKGIVVEAAPNEVFYSFHKDEIHAASLLHPCKVAFLRKSVELPSGISAFVCRRVYDIDNNCLRWLTDKDYINVSLHIYFIFFHYILCLIVYLLVCDLSMDSGTAGRSLQAIR
jgi:hypothetical protein